MGDTFEINIPEKPLVAHITFVPEKRPRWRQIQRAMRMVGKDQFRIFMEKSLRTQGVKVDLIGVCNGKRIELVNIKPELHGGDMAFTIGGEQDG